MVLEVVEFGAIDVNVKLLVVSDPNELDVPAGEPEAVDDGVSRESAWGDRSTLIRPEVVFKNRSSKNFAVQGSSLARGNTRQNASQQTHRRLWQKRLDSRFGKTNTLTSMCDTTLCPQRGFGKHQNPEHPLEQIRIREIGAHIHRRTL